MLEFHSDFYQKSPPLTYSALKLFVFVQVYWVDLVLSFYDVIAAQKSYN